MKSISCKDAVGYILKKEEGKLSLREKIALWQHLVICKLCKTFALQNKLINQTVKKRQEVFRSLSEDEKDKIIQNILKTKE